MDALELKPKLAELAADGIYVGTSSWKYSGWIGQLYDEQWYVYRGKFAESRFKKNCLAEYAETFKTVCADTAYCQFPTREANPKPSNPSGEAAPPISKKTKP